MKINYIKLLLKTYPDIANGRKRFHYFEKRIKLSLGLAKKYQKKKYKIEDFALETIWQNNLPDDEFKKLNYEKTSFIINYFICFM